MKIYRIAWIDNCGYPHVCSGFMTRAEATAEIAYYEENNLCKHPLIVLKCDNQTK